MILCSRTSVTTHVFGPQGEAAAVTVLLRAVGLGIFRAERVVFGTCRRISSHSGAIDSRIGFPVYQGVELGRVCRSKESACCWCCCRALCHHCIQEATVQLAYPPVSAAAVRTLPSDNPAAEEGAFSSVGWNATGCPYLISGVLQTDVLLPPRSDRLIQWTVVPCK